MKKECIYTLFLKILLVFFRVSLDSVIMEYKELVHKAEKLIK